MMNKGFIMLCLSLLLISSASTISLVATYPYIWRTQPNQITSGLRILPSQITAVVDVAPDLLTLRSMGKWITAYIQLPEEYSPENIAASSILLNETIPPILDPKYSFVTNSSEYLVDHNNDGILERMVKFNRTAVSEYILSKGIRHGNATLTAIGQLNDGTQFEGNNAIMVRLPGDANCDGKVDTLDLYELGKAYDSTPDSSNWSIYCDFNEDSSVGASDLLEATENYGTSAP